MTKAQVLEMLRGDPDRDAVLLAGRVTLQVMPGDALTLAASIEASRRMAANEVYSADRRRIGASVEWRIGARSYLSLVYAHQRGDEVFYRETTSGTLDAVRGPVVGFFGRSEEAYRGDATSHAIAPGLELSLGERSALEVTQRFTMVSSAAGDFQASSTYAGLVFRR